MPYAYEISLKKAKELLQKGQYPEAAFEFFQAANQGSVEARRIFQGKVDFKGQYDIKNEASKTPDHPFRLALMHLMGLGVKRDDEEACKILQQWLGDKEQLDISLLNPNAPLLQACDLLGCLFSQGRGVKQNHQEALAWFQLAAEKNPHAMTNLGGIYSQGYGVEKNLETAFAWHQQGAEGGDLMAIHNLGFAYAAGDGVDQDTEAAVKWLQRAADAGLPLAMFNLGHMLREGWEGIMVPMIAAIVSGVVFNQEKGSLELLPLFLGRVRTDVARL